jgi:hypothetical protein
MCSICFLKFNHFNGPIGSIWFSSFCLARDSCPLLARRESHDDLAAALLACVVRDPLILHLMMCSQLGLSQERRVGSRCETFSCWYHGWTFISGSVSLSEEINVMNCFELSLHRDGSTQGISGGVLQKPRARKQNCSRPRGRSAFHASLHPLLSPARFIRRSALNYAFTVGELIAETKEERLGYATNRSRFRYMFHSQRSLLFSILLRKRKTVIQTQFRARCICIGDFVSETALPRSTSRPVLLPWTSVVFLLSTTSANSIACLPSLCSRTRL